MGAGLDDERVWAIEDCRHVSRRFEQALIAAGERVVRVAPHRMGPPGGASANRASRTRSTRSRSPGRSSRTAWSASPPPPRRVAMEIRLLSDHRKDLVAERTRVQNRLRWHLLELCPELERSLGRGALAGPRQLARVDRRLCRLRPAPASESRASRSRSCASLTRRADALERELLALVRAHRPQLLAETGCGALTAALLIGRTAGAERFPKRRQLRPPDRHRADSMLLRPTPPPPARPRRRPPAQPRAARHRHHPRPP